MTAPDKTQALLPVTQAITSSIRHFVRHDADCHVTHEGEEAPCSCGARVALSCFDDLVARISHSLPGEAWVQEVSGILKAVIPSLEEKSPLRDRIAAALTPSPCPGDVGMREAIKAPAWIVGDSSGTRWRTWTALGPDWTEDREKATRYARREDAEQAHEADEEAWRVQRYIAAFDAGEGGGANMLSGCMEFSEQLPVAALTPSALSGDAGEGEPNGVAENKAGGLWYRRWFKAQARVNELERGPAKAKGSSHG